MPLSQDFVADLQVVPLKDIIEILKSVDRPSFGTRWILKNEVRPVDLYCYFGARFGAPNGIQNFLRADHSDNLIHWEWFLRSGDRFIFVQGMNFRTEVWISGETDLSESDKDLLTNDIKSHFAMYGREMGTVRKALEHWVEFVNPYQRLRRSVKSLLNDLESLGLNATQDSVLDISDCENIEEFQGAWEMQAEKYHRAIGLSFGIRSMLPVMAEAFVNMILYTLMKPDLKSDERLKENLIRQPIDIRIRGLAHNCNGFKKIIDYSSEACGRYHTLVNERNDLLHGNVVIDKLRFNELYFHGRVPVFIQYLSMWERSLGVAHKSVGLDKVNEELAVVDGLVEYLLSCLDDQVRANVELSIESFHLGLNMENGRLGVLFPAHVVDFSTVLNKEEH
jgi:hypothetical protein